MPGTAPQATNFPSSETYYRWLCGEYRYNSIENQAHGGRVRMVQENGGEVVLSAEGPCRRQEYRHNAQEEDDQCEGAGEEYVG